MKAVMIGDNPEGYLHSVVAIDVETTGLKWTSDLLGFSMAWRHQNQVKSCYFSLIRDGGQLSLDAYSEKWPVKDISGLIESIPKMTVVGHNWPFDYRMLMKTFGLPPIPHSYDTMVMGQMIAWVEKLNLESMYNQFVGPFPPWVARMKKVRAKFKDLDLKSQANYAKADSRLTLELFEALIGPYKAQIGDSTIKETMAFSELCMKMCQRGLPVDDLWLSQRKGSFRHSMMQIQIEFIRKGLKNLSSAVQIAKWMEHLGIDGERTEKGQLKTDKNTIEHLAQFHSELDGIVRFREFEKAIGSWIDPLWDMSRIDGKVHGILAPYGTRSFRMSSTDINLQAIPLHDRGRAYGGFHGVFKDSDPDYRLFEIDVSQAEVRFASIISAESNLSRLLSSDADVYKALSSRMWNTQERRQDAKSAMLSSIYCIGYTAYSIENDVSIEKAQAILTDFQRNFPKINRATRYWERFVVDERYVPLPISNKNRKIYFDPQDERTYRGFNQIVQGTVAEFIGRAMLTIEDEMPGILLHQIHDSIITRVHKSETDKLERAKEIITNEVVPEKLLDRTDPQVRLLANIEKWD